MANANSIINDDMTLEEKLSAIDLAMANAQAQANDNRANGVNDAPVDPQDFLMCDGCQ